MRVRARLFALALAAAIPLVVSACASPGGSSASQACPTSERTPALARITSGLIEVEITGPVADITAGTITALVFPERGGPSTITALSGSARTQWPAPTVPR